MNTSLAQAAAVITLACALVGCGKGDEKFRAQLDPVVARITERANAAAALTGKPPAEVVEGATAIITDLSGLGADLKALYVDGEKQQELVAAGQAYLSATHRFILGQQEFANAYSRLEASRRKVRESLDAKVRTSKFSMDFWTESHGRLVVELDNVRKENEKLRDKVLVVTTGLQQAADTAGALLGRQALVSAATIDAHRKALAAVPLEKGA